MIAGSIGASAPGKILVAGEYAVIDGAEAVLIAVDRRAIARVGEREVALSPFLAAARDELARELGDHSPAMAAAARVVVDTSALRAGHIKLGLGSSAAATVAALGAALGASGHPIDPPVVHALAHRAHRTAQAQLGAPGSGADVAACVYGGAIAVRRTADAGTPLDVRPVALPPELALVAVWTGAAADTATLVAQVRGLRQRDRDAYERATRRIGDAAAAVLGAFERRSAVSVVEAIAAAGDAIAELGRAAAVELEGPVHRQLRWLAERRGGACKPTGAGAGDLALAAFESEDAAAAFRRDVEAAGMRCPALAVDPCGVEASLVAPPGAKVRS
jgi:phosphomevalonate kinase